MNSAIHSEQPEVMTLREAAVYLRISERKCWELVKNQELPHFRCGSRIRLSTAAVREWILRQTESPPS